MALKIHLLSVLLVAAIFAGGADGVGVAAPKSKTAAPTPPTAARNSTTAASNSTTAASNSTTAASNSTTAASNSTTAASNSTTAASNSTTAASNSTTAASNSTTAASNSTTVASNSTTAAPPGTTAAPPLPPNPCASNPCGDRSTCQPNIDRVFVCLCPAGERYNYNSSRCQTAKVFPGEFQTTEPYVTEMADPNSKQFQEFSQKIVADIQLRLANFTGPDPVVLKLLPSTAATPASRSGGPTVKAIVQIIFPPGSDVTVAKLTDAMDKECIKCSVRGSFTSQTLCQVDACDPISSECTSTDGGFNCTCRPGYKQFHSDRVCVAECPTGQQFTGSECTDCAFGYTGFNCEEHWKRDLVIVGAVLGGLLLISIILAIVFAVKSPKKSSMKSKNADLGKSFNSRPPVNTRLDNSNLDFNRAAAGSRSANGYGNGNGEVPRIPRATANSGWDSRTNLEMTPSHSRQNLIAPSRPQNNPYGQNRPQANPYAQNQGRTNVYNSVYDM